MSSRTIRNTIFCAGMALVSSTFAGTEVLKCTDDAGRVTLTDQPCKDAAGQVVLALAADASATAEPPPASNTAHYRLASLPPSPQLRAAPYTEVRAPGRALAGDVATLKEARRTLMLLDNTMAASRKHGLAAQR